MENLQARACCNIYYPDKIHRSGYYMLADHMITEAPKELIMSGLEPISYSMIIKL